MEEPAPPKRFIDHPYDINEIPLSAKLQADAFDATLTEMLVGSKFWCLNSIGLKVQEKENPADSMVVKQSKGKPFHDPFIYLGTGGTAYMYYRLYLQALRALQTEQANDYLAKAMQAL